MRSPALARKDASNGRCVIRKVTALDECLARLCLFLRSVNKKAEKVVPGFVCSTCRAAPKTCKNGMAYRKIMTMCSRIWDFLSTMFESDGAGVDECCACVMGDLSGLYE